jgi:hypothetical protein
VINPDAAARGGLKISSKLLALAIVVYDAPTDPAIPLNARDLLQLADDALYCAKDRGRNRSELGTAGNLAGGCPSDARAVPAQSFSK